MASLIHRAARFVNSAIAALLPRLPQSGSRQRAAAANRRRFAAAFCPDLNQKHTPNPERKKQNKKTSKGQAAAKTNQEYINAFGALD
jgi:hypothetical protein